VRLGQQLFDIFLQFYASSNFSRIILDTPEKEKRSHFFYQKQGFKQISKEQLDVSYIFPDRDSRFYEKLS